MEDDDIVPSRSLISSVETLTNKDEVDEEDEGTGDGGGESSLNEVKVLDIFEDFFVDESENNRLTARDLFD